MSKETELKPCKCGCEAELVESQAFSWCDIKYYVRCTNPVCEERGALKYEHKIDAINAWNRRQVFLSPLTEEKLLINDSKSNNSEDMSNSGDCKNCNSYEEKQVKEIASLMCRVYDGSCDECGFSSWCCIYDDARNMYNAGYRKQSENVIEIPCKVGDITYIFDYEVNNHLETKFRGIAPSVVEAITIVDDGLWIENEHAKYHISSVGDLIFLTKEEAEQALAKMKGGAE